MKKAKEDSEKIESALELFLHTKRLVATLRA